MKIVQKEDPVLRQTAKEIPIKDIGSTKIKKILREMEKALATQGDGVAIAAPQIGYSLRIFIVAGKVFDKDFMKEREDRFANKEEPRFDLLPGKEKEKSKNKNLIFINPKISKLSREKKWVPEGCLSVRWLYGKTNRSVKASVQALDENGKKFIRGGSELLAQIFQHETDHLNGILFIDHAKDVKEEKPN